MKDNDLDNFSIQPMSARHFEIVQDQLRWKRLPKVVEQAVRAVLVDLLEPAAARAQYSLASEELVAALDSYSEAWSKYCEDNDLVTGVFWLSPEIAECAKAIEAHMLNRIEQRRKRAIDQPPASDKTDKS